jgi:hypothetical protein
LAVEVEQGKRKRVELFKRYVNSQTDVSIVRVCSLPFHICV